VVIYESTVYPGCTEEVCAPILERESGLRYIIEDANADAFPGFYCGYSPERINPGDKTHRLPSIKKVTSGSTLATAQAVDNLYKEIISAGTHLASSIKVAEAAKVIENTQRDLNIALMNELSMIFSRMNIDTRAVLDAASTKWNFLNFYPGLVGGHCIGVDPYYLTHKAQMLGYDPQVILAGRRINDSMGKFVSDKTIQSMIKAKIPLDGAKVILLGLTFKENCPDTRNSRVPALVRELESYGLEVFAHDPFADANEAYAEYGLRLMQWDALPMADAVLVAVRHQFYRERGPTEIIKKMKKNCGITDVKGLFSASDFPNASFFWTL
jgi:UDP-N-acetyl-D-galactosamine dehydrogenase